MTVSIYKSKTQIETVLIKLKIICLHIFTIGIPIFFLLDYLRFCCKTVTSTHHLAYVHSCHTSIYCLTLHLHHLLLHYGHILLSLHHFELLRVKHLLTTLHHRLLHHSCTSIHLLYVHLF